VIEDVEFMFLSLSHKGSYHNRRPPTVSDGANPNESLPPVNRPSIVVPNPFAPVSEEPAKDRKPPEKLAPVWRALVEVGFIVFLYYSNLLMGEFEGSGLGRKNGLLWAGHDILTPANFTIAIVTAFMGYVVFEYLRKRF
jgi:hypothetical protein